MKCTLNHPDSMCGCPVFVNQNGESMPELEGMLALMKLCSLTSAQVADFCGVSVRTVEGWRSGKRIPISALNVFGQILTKRRYRNRSKK